MIQLSYSEHYPIPLPAGHRFPFGKYKLLREQLEYLDLIKPEQLFAPTFIEDEIIHLTHSPEWWALAKQMALGKQAYRKIGFPNVPELISRSLSSASGTLHCAVNALQVGAGMNLAGGTHHAFFDHGEGFCLLNDIAIAANYLLHAGLAKRILIVDLDVHQGNGTAAIFENEARVFTFSMHCRENYPFRKMKSDLDIEVPAFSTDDFYLKQLKTYVPGLFQSFKPDIVFYLAGVDVLESDQLGKLNLSKEGCRLRDEWVISQARIHDLPLVVVMGGGYNQNYAPIVNAHCNTFKLALEYYENFGN